MEENQNGMYGEESHTYGEDTRRYQNQFQGGEYSQQYGQPNSQYMGQSYGQPNSQYMGQSYGQPNGMLYQQQIPVKDIFCNILLVVMPVRIIVGLVMNVMLFSSMGEYIGSGFANEADIYSMLDGSYTVLSLISSLLMLIYIVFVILDIVNVHKANYKITGLILFAIFLTPGYYIWRAYILKRRKMWPIIYTVLFSLIMIANFVITFCYSFAMVSDIVMSM